MGEVYICDTTLRDGRQMPGVYLTLYECIEIARMLDEIGVDQIEVFSPSYVIKDYYLIRELNKMGLSDKLLVWHRGLRRDLEKSIGTRLDFGAVALSIATEKGHREKKLRMTKEQIMETMCEAVTYAKDHDSMSPLTRRRAWAQSQNTWWSSLTRWPMRERTG